MSATLTITEADFARAFGAAGELSPLVRNLIQGSDFHYERLSRAERDQVVLDILGKLRSDAFTKVGAHRQEVWEQGWSKNLQEFAGKGHELEELVPRFVRRSPIVRLNGDFVRVSNPEFEYHFFRVFRSWLFQSHMAPADAVYEFGCGSGYNLVALAELFPQKKLYGLDWAESSVDLVNLTARKHHFKMEGRRFDFFAPDPTLQLAPRSVALTMCALEQVGLRFEDFLQFILKQSPMLCINMEPLVELYDPNNLVDYLAISYHKQRGYLDGYLTRLQQLATEGKIELLKTERLQFGSLYHEGYSYIMWRP